MNQLVKMFTGVVAFGLLWLTIGGAYALTGNVAMTLVLSALVVIQWASAQRAMQALSLQGSGALSQRLSGALPNLMLWMVAASISVSFAAAELFEMFGARNRAESQFGLAQGGLRERARLLDEAFRRISATAEQVKAHAKRMAELEEREGGSCAIGRGPGPGEIRSFRRQDAEAAGSLTAQVKPAAERASTILDTVRAMSFEGNVPELRRMLAQTVGDLNALQRSTLWTQVREFATARLQAAASIPLQGGQFACDDVARGQLLAELQRIVGSVSRLEPLREPAVLDHTDVRGMALAMIIRTWSVPLGWLPERLFRDGGLVDPVVRERYGLDQAHAFLGPDALPLQMAWLLELLMLALLAMDNRGRGAEVHRRPFPSTTRKLLHWAAEQLNQQPGWRGEVARAMFLPPAEALMIPPPYIDKDLFPDAGVRCRAGELVPWYRPWGRRDLIVVPLDEPTAARAARELMRLNLLRHRVTGLRTEQLIQERNLDNVMSTVMGEVPQTTWAVYEICSEQFARWLLAQRDLPGQVPLHLVR